MGREGVGRVAGRSVVMGKAVGRREVARRAAVVGPEVNKAAAVAVPRAREAVARVKAALARARVEVPRVTTMVLLMAAARVGVGLGPVCLTRRQPRT